MGRITTTLVAVMLLSNSAVTIMAASGFTEDIGVQLAPGINDEMDKLISEMKKGFSPNAGVGDSLRSIFVSSGRLFLVLVEALFAMPTMLMNLGFPDYLVTAFFAPAYMLSTLEIVLLITNRNAVG